MPADFSHIKSLDVSTEKPARFKLHQITVNDVTPTLLVVPATETNKPYFNALLKRSGKSARAARSGTISLGMIADNRKEERDLYPQHVIVGWEDMVDGRTGEEVEFSKAECINFLVNLPNWLFDDIRAFCSNPASFVTELEVEVVAKNLLGDFSGN